MIQSEIPGKLKAIQVKQAKPRDKVYKLSDGKGLNLEIHPNGSKYWRLSYRFQNKQKTLALGVSPVVTLAITTGFWAPAIVNLRSPFRY